MKKARQFLMGAIIALTMVVQAFPVFAAENVYDPDARCFITVDASTDRLTGESLAIYQVGEVDETSNSLTFQWASDFEDVGFSIDELSDESYTVTDEHLALLDAASQDSEPLEVKKFDENGEILFIVDPGVYLMVQVDRVKAEIQTTIAVVPRTIDDGSGWTYEARTEPKWTIPGIPTPETGDMDVQTMLYISVGLGAICLIGMAVIARMLYQTHKEKKKMGL